MQAKRLLQHLLLVSLLVAEAAFAYDSRLSVNKDLNLADLARTGQIVVKTERDGDRFYSDASAVLSRVNFQKLMAASADFNHYDEMGMPNVLDSRIVARTGDILYTWTHMSTQGQTSKHYLEVRLYPTLGTHGAAGSEWEQTRRQSSWTLPDQSAFKRLEGSWYAEPLADGKIYVRYYLTGVFDTWIPAAIIDWIVKNQFTDGVTKVIQVLARQAAIRP